MSGVTNRNFIGKEFITRKGGIFTLTGFISKDKVTGTCTICSIDTELFPSDFATNISTLNNGGSPCGCSRFTKWTQEQQLIRCKRIAIERGDVVVLGYAEEYHGNKTRLLLKCNDEECGITSNSVCVDKFLSGRGCPSCGNKRIYDSFRKEWAAQNMLSPKGGVITIIEDLKTLGIKVHCTECEKDKELFGDGCFISNKDSWTYGSIPCGCSKNFRWSEAQYIVKMKRREAEVSGKLKFLGFAEEFKGGRTHIIQNCLQEESHGTWDTATIMSCQYTGCPTCGIGLYGYYKHRENELDILYLLEFTDGEEVFIKIGRAFDLEDRLTYYPNDVYNIKVLAVLEGLIHKHIFRLEGELHFLVNEHHYTPLIPFGGSVNECFTLDALNNKYVISTFSL